MDKEIIQDKTHESSSQLTGKKALISIVTIIGSLGSFLLSSRIGGMICRALDISGYKAQFICALISLTFYTVILALLHKKKVLYSKGNGFFGGLITGFLMIYASITSVINALFLDTSDNKMKFVTPTGLKFGSEQVWCILALLFAAGICEELLFRGIIFNVLRDLFGRDSTKGTIAAIFTSGVLFGLYHLLNIFAGVSIDAVIPQVISTAGVGVFLAAVYARWGNIWITVFLHAFMDICVVLPTSMKNNADIVESINTTMSDPTKYIGVVVYVILAIYLLREEKRPQMFTYSVSDD
ncbi:CPBP family intramembrane glutamic endopeptidase [Ruminococcus albus]|uniref:CAAX prenyl protease 2/Lysostaphin resistance protein A-like domain-containing protein n=1 Tax=Ruminococcus albus TaxID=1264 RepID=A0A1I1DGT3_RUMAL|nr:CPBP family intramembrane glutamic endopeptidase [Ruminococcus albus]SFB74057.1 hypothetical protein SAMN02910406_00416 [Ruminococcus albus]